LNTQKIQSVFQTKEDFKAISLAGFLHKERKKDLVMSVDFVHLHCHTNYSLYDGFMSPLNLARRAKELDMPAVAITDHGKAAGFIKFQDACKPEKEPDDAKKKKSFNPAWTKDIKPIFGCEMYLCHNLEGKKNEKRYHIVILAKNNEGLKNVNRLSAIGHEKTAYGFPRVDFEKLKAHSEGLIVMSACINGEIPQLIFAGEMESAKEILRMLRTALLESLVLAVDGVVRKNILTKRP